MSDSEENQKSSDGKKHIKFTNSVEETEKEQTSPRGKSTKMPKHDREVERFRIETLQQIRVFRAARKQWMRSVADSEVGKTDVDNTMYSLEIDKRSNARTNTRVKELFDSVWGIIREYIQFCSERLIGFPMLNFSKFLSIESGKNLTLRDLATARAQLEARNAAFNKKIKLNFMKDFKKLAKKAAKRIQAESKAPIKADREGAVTSRLKPIPEEEAAGKANDLKEIPLTLEEVGFNINVGEKSKISGNAQAKQAAGPSAGETTEQEQDGLSAESREMFNKIVRKLENNPKYSGRPITDEEINEMKSMWRVYRPPLIEERENKIEGEEEAEKLEKEKPPKKRSMENAFKWIKKKVSTQPKPELRPCSCQITEGDGVIILKNVCDCSGKLQGAKAVILESESVGRTITKIPVVTDESRSPESRFSVEKIIDSLEVLRKKLTSKSLPILQGEESSFAPKKSMPSLTEEGVQVEEIASQDIAEKVSTIEEHVSRESNEENAKPTKHWKINNKSSGKIKPSGYGRIGKVSTNKIRGKSILGKKKCKNPKVGLQHVSFEEVKEKQSKEETSNKVAKTVMSVVSIFRRPL